MDKQAPSTGLDELKDNQHYLMNKEKQNTAWRTSILCIWDKL
jgi:hypothetical protein